MGWQDRLFNWIDGQVSKHPEVDNWLESHLHAYGMHGPQARHLLKTQILPDAMVVVTVLILLITALVVWRVRRRRARRRRTYRQRREPA